MNRFGICAVALAILSFPGSARAQQSNAWDPGRLLVTRGDLEDLLARFEQAARSPAYSEALRERARYEGSLIRQRLQEGDFQVGDQISLRVEGEPQLSADFTVAYGRVLNLPIIGEIPLGGVLRSELESHLSHQLGRFIQDPVVHARSLIRIPVFGEVGRPGFYLVSTEMLLTDVLMLAGGPTRSAKLTEIRVERSGRRIWGSEPLQEGIIEGRTLDQLNLRAGDQIQIPQRGGGLNVGEVVRFALFGGPALIFAVTQIF